MNFSQLKSSVFFKIFVIAILILMLLIPTTMVKQLIYERERIQKNAINEVSAKWGNGQTLTGPFLSIPYDKFIKQYSAKDSTEKIIKLKEWINFLPEDLIINGNISPEKRYRGIHEVVVYESSLNMKGKFNAFDISKFDIAAKNIHFDQARLNLGITDLKGIEKQVTLKWNADNISFDSGTSNNNVIGSGINAKTPTSYQDSSNYAFDLNLDLKGSQNLYFIPMGKTTDVNLSSDWTTPSFTGTFLPDERAVDAKGFNAHWNILHLNRNYPQSWLNGQHHVKQSAFGTDLLLPVDNYKKSYRVARYAILFIVLTFLVFFFVEILNGVYIHPIQYLLVGMALVIFYSLLLSFSEHIKFNYAYFVSAVLTLGLITAYIMAILKSKQIAGMMFGILLILYTFIFTIIQLEDYALLIGSLGVFLILCIVMYFSRKIDWYNIRLGNPRP